MEPPGGLCGLPCEGSGKLVRRVSLVAYYRSPDPCRESRREQAIAMTREDNPFEHLSGASLECGSMFDSLRSAMPEKRTMLVNVV